MIPSAWFSSTRPAPSTKMARFRRRAGCGQCCQASVPHGHWKTTTFTGALRLSGMTAPLVLDEPINRAAFQAYIQQVLGPALRSGDTMILDNLPAQKRGERAPGHRTRWGDAALFARLQSNRERLLQPQGVPAQGSGSPIDGLWDASRNALPTITQPECANYFTAAGYEPE